MLVGVSQSGMVVLPGVATLLHRRPASGVPDSGPSVNELGIWLPGPQHREGGTVELLRQHRMEHPPMELLSDRPVDLDPTINLEGHPLHGVRSPRVPHRKLDHASLEGFAFEQGRMQHKSHIDFGHVDGFLEEPPPDELATLFPLVLA
ncbi:hypothetical protein C4D60_Mb06t24990 [Musa balbisiana]|uniref:Uncharacterized protein n=1 Tax=Musa balbisiana TaxID=52838 RepID=A0A4S8IQH5_MUSBA|nr:hypothetical protein C4D60_Mb06t24990 [Musa balbisiana]